MPSKGETHRQARHVGPPGEANPAEVSVQRDQLKEGARWPTKSDKARHVGHSQLVVPQELQGEARRPTNCDKARHVGHGQLVVPHVRQTGTNRKARRVGPPRAVPFSRDSNQFKKPSTRDLARRGTSAHQVKSTQAETPFLFEVGPKRPTAR